MLTANAQADYELALEAVAGFEWHLPQGAAPEQVRSHAGWRQRGAKMSIPVGVQAQA